MKVKALFSFILSIIFTLSLFCNQICNITVADNMGCSVNHSEMTHPVKTDPYQQSENHKSKKDECCNDKIQIITILKNITGEFNFEYKFFPLKENFISFRETIITSNLFSLVPNIDDPPSERAGYHLRISMQSFLL